jgi:hypothetical protein
MYNSHIKRGGGMQPRLQRNWLFGVFSFCIVSILLMGDGALALVFSWFSIIVWNGLILLIFGICAAGWEKQAREVERLRREIKRLEQVIDAELERTALPAVKMNPHT